MQAAAHLASLSFLPSQSSKTLRLSGASFPITKHPLLKTSRSRQNKLVALAAAVDTPEIDYNSMTSSVFPAEACETIGGVACDVEMYPETKLKAEPRATEPASEAVDREYLEYTDPKTVFPGEACDDLGGEFCEPDYQSGVY